MSIVCRKFQHSIRMKIKSIRHSGFRVYGDDVSIVPESTGQKPLVFVGGQNGFGKSTFITSILWCLYGKLISHVDEPFMRMIRLAGGYSSFLEQSVNKYAKEQGFYVEVVFEGVQLPGLNSAEILICRSFKKGKEELQILIDDLPNELVDSLGFELFIQEYILPKEVARFFLFDAERITNLAESRGASERRELGNAYEKVLGVKKYLEIREQLQLMRERTLAMDSSPKVIKELEGLDEKVGSLESQISVNNDSIEIATNQMLELKQQREELSLELFSHGFMGDALDIESLQQEEDELKQRVRQASDAIKEKMDVVPFLLSTKWFEELVTQVENNDAQLPKSAQSALRKVVDAWSSEMKVDENVLNDLKHRLSDFYVGSQNSDFTGAIQKIDTDQLRELQGKMNWLKAWLVSTHAQLKRDRAALNRLKSKLNKLNRSGSNEEVTALRSKIEAVDNSIQKALTARVEAEIDSDNCTRELTVTMKRRSEILKNIEVSERSTKKIEVLDSINGKLKNFVDAFKEQRRKNLEKRITVALKSMFHKDVLIDAVSIAIDDGGMDLTLLDSDGVKVPKESLSMGEKQLYAVALLKALIDESGMEFPVVVDSPLQKLDPDHALMLLDQVFPELSSQVFVLPLPNKELTRGEFEKIEHRVSSLHLIKHSQGSSRVEKCGKDEFFQLSNADFQLV